MRYVYFSFILITLLIILSLCSGCSYNTRPNTPLHDIHDTDKSIHTREKNKIIDEKTILYKQKETLLEDIQNIDFD